VYNSDSRMFLNFNTDETLSNISHIFILQMLPHRILMTF